MGAVENKPQCQKVLSLPRDTFEKARDEKSIDWERHSPRSGRERGRGGGREGGMQQGCERGGS